MLLLSAREFMLTECLLEFCVGKREDERKHPEQKKHTVIHRDLFLLTFITWYWGVKLN